MTEFGKPPRVFLLDGASLLAARRRVYDGDPALSASDQRLLQDAEDAGAVGPFSVVHKASPGPGGDVHDYVSQAPYWWPDPDIANGLPYVRRDGELNPERDVHDLHALAALCSAVNTLAVAWFYSEHEDFAERAGLLLRTWFLDPQTRMNPHLMYAQSIAGSCPGRAKGIIDAAQLAVLVDSVGLLEGAAAWTEEDHQGMVQWMSEYLSWLLDSKFGQQERQQVSHHGTFYDVQVLALALFTGNQSAADVVASRAAARLEQQVEADGSQPGELARTRSLSCSALNLTGLFDLADLGLHCKVDLWQHEGNDGRCLRRALDWLVTNAIDSEWIRPQVEPYDEAQWVPLLRRATQRSGDSQYVARIAKLPDIGPETEERSLLLYPDPV